VKGCKEKQHVIIGPLPNSINLQEDGLKKEKEESDPDHLSGNHHKEIGPIGHLPHQPNLDQKTKQFEISTQSTPRIKLDLNMRNFVDTGTATRYTQIPRIGCKFI
jgi:hypothetical protein